MNCARRAARGYTMIELFAVVTIVGVLSAIAIYGMNRYLRYAKTAEAGEVLSSIQAGQEAYFEETFRYLDVTGNNFYPAALTVDGGTKVQWGAPDGDGSCTGCRDRFLTIGVTVSQPVVFRYSVRTGAAGTNPGGLVNGVSLTHSPFAAVSSAPQHYFVAVAASDLVPGGEPSLAIASSFQGEMYTEDLGE